MNFVSATFLFGLIAVGGPTLIHLINRRRYRTVEWAAMRFLRDAVQRNKRYLELRDLILLILRTLAVLLFVLAMSRPYWSDRAAGALTDQPVHAVLVLDNSLSMGWATLDESLLDSAKEKAADFVEALPDGSVVSVVPMVGEMADFKDAYVTREDAIEAINQVRLQDRSAVLSVAADRARSAAMQQPETPTKRVVFVGDLQRDTWQGSDLARELGGLADVQVAQVSPDVRENTWVDRFEIRDGVADAETPAVFVAYLRHTGESARRNLRVTLKVDGLPVDERFVDVLPGQNLRLRFEHRFDVAGTSREPLFVPVELSISPDRLSEDDRRVVIVPVVARVPMVFIDQYTDEEEKRLRREGETWPLRRWLAPQTGDEGAGRYLVDIRHRTPETVTRDDLRDARVAVIAGVREIDPALVRLLREYVEQGGLVLIGAGGEFDASAWQASAWQGGEGILPMPLAGDPIGRLPLPDERETETFRLDTKSLTDEIFHLDLPAEELTELYATPFFFKAIVADESALNEFTQRESERVRARREWLREYERREAEWAMLEQRGQLIPEQQAERAEARRRRVEMFPDWLAWQNPLRREDTSLTVEQVVDRSRPRVMGRYDNGRPFLVRRDIGQGRVVMVTTGIYPLWNSLAVQPSVLIFDQLMHGMLTRSLPSRTLGPVNEIVVPIPPEYQASTFALEAPGREGPIPLGVEALGEESYGLIIREVNRRGIYRIRVDEPGPDTADTAASVTADAGWSMLLAVNGPGGESDLSGSDRAAMEEAVAEAEAAVRFLDADEAISLSGAGFRGANLWWWLMAGALACVAAEMLFLAGPSMRAGGGR